MPDRAARSRSSDRVPARGLRRPSKFIVLADNMKSAIKMAWDHGGADFRITL